MLSRTPPALLHTTISIDCVNCAHSSCVAHAPVGRVIWFKNIGFIRLTPCNFASPRARMSISNLPYKMFISYGKSCFFLKFVEIAAKSRWQLCQSFTKVVTCRMRFVPAAEWGLAFNKYHTNSDTSAEWVMYHNRYYYESAGVSVLRKRVSIDLLLCKRLMIDSCEIILFYM